MGSCKPLWPPVATKNTGVTGGFTGFTGVSGVYRSYRRFSGVTGCGFPGSPLFQHTPLGTL